MNRNAEFIKRGVEVSGGVGSRVWQMLDCIADTAPDRSAVEEFGPEGRSRRWSYAELRTLSVSLAAVLADRFQPGTVVALEGAGGARQIAWMLAGIRAGLWVLPLPTQTTRDELAELRRQSGAAAIIGRERQLGECDWIDWATRAPAGRQESGAALLGGIVLVTSGTTGGAKLVTRDSEALDADAANVIAGTGMCAQDRVLVTLSLSHSYGIDMVVSGLLAGATLELVPVFDLGTVTHRLASGVTVFPSVPFLFEALIPRWVGAGALRLVFSAGARMPDATRRAFERETRLPIGDLYGSSELGTVIFRDPWSEMSEPGLIGSPLPGVSARILSLEDPTRVLGPGTEGELAIRSPSMLRGYLDGPAAFSDGHFLTGDLARVDVKGRVFLTGRLKHVIETGGFKLNPIELERLIETHPEVGECLVLGMPISETVSRVKALVVPRRPEFPPSEADLRGFLRSRVSASKVPRRFEIVPSLPRSATGKVLRTEPNGASA